MSLEQDILPSDKEFIRVCSIKEIPRRRGKEIVFDEETQVAIFNIDDTLYAVSNICPHQHAPVIADGYIEDCTITCPLHGWVYDLRSGRAIGGTGKLKTYDIYLDGENVMLERPEPEEPTWTI
ncbi:MAG TPA: Rieske (2Fe-2S) protein [Candidatus Kapabacteria bacterium]|nr:Rieske (2Fe-2S) protein [Candidatus Kapabacteria bacterium]